MKKGVCIVNVVRGGVIDEDALVRALESGVVAQAALDVFTEETPSKDSKLVHHPNVTVTPHLGASTKEAQEGVAVEISEAVVGALNGELSATAVNAPNVDSKFASFVTDNGEISILGQVKDGIPRLTCIGSFGVDVSLEGNLILCRQVDQPGMIGLVGNILGERNVTVSFMTVGQTIRHKQAIMAIGVDEEPNKETLRKIGEVKAIEECVPEPMTIGNMENLHACIPSL